MYTPALIANWQIWPLIQLVNFRFVPLRLRVPFTSFCGIACESESDREGDDLQALTDIELLLHLIDSLANRDAVPQSASGLKW